MKRFRGLLFIKHGRVGTKSEGPDYYIQTSGGDLLLRYEERDLWKPDYHLEFYNRRMVEIIGKINEEGGIDVESIQMIFVQLIPQYTIYKVRIANNSNTEIVNIHLSIIGLNQSVSIPELPAGKTTGYYEFTLKNLREKEPAPVSYGDYTGGYTHLETKKLIFIPAPPAVVTVNINDKDYSSEGEWPIQSPEPELVAEVTKVALTVFEGESRQLKITAAGNVSTGGWTDACLRPRLYNQVPPDGIYDYDFLATSPDGPAPTLIAPVTASLMISPIPKELKGVRIHARRNTQVALLKEEHAYFEFTDSKDNFVIKLIGEDKIQHARAILEGADVTRRHIAGTVVKKMATYNPKWSYHLKPDSICLFDSAIEVCDASIQYVEEHLDEVGGSFLPDNQWCPWNSELSQELRYQDNG